MVYVMKNNSIPKKGASMGKFFWGNKDKKLKKSNISHSRHLVSISDLSKEWWDELYSRCSDIIKNQSDYVDSCRGKVLATMFFEPSTRTSFSFQSAAQRLGGDSFGFSDPLSTSASKGETLADTVRMVASYAHSIVIRTPQEGAATVSSMYSNVPVINAGDGGHFHPTQTLCDLTTIMQKRGEIKNLTVGICGDLKFGRTTHSLAQALGMFPNIKFRLLSPSELRMPEYVLELIRSNGQEYEESELFAENIPDLDILYMTRIQRERFHSSAEYRRLKGVFVLDKELMKTAKKDMLVMHPLPRYGEILPEVDDDSRAVYFEQAEFGMFIRMALLCDFLHQPKKAPTLVPSGDTAPIKCENPSCITQTEIYLPQITAKNEPNRCGYCDKDFPRPETREFTPAAEYM